jgi:PQQ-dependent catabolism-associated CXXCW motif protein
MTARSSAVAAFALAFLIGAADAPPEPDSYRMDNYRAPTPATLRGATVLSTDEAHAHWEKQDAAFVDVLPQVPRPAGLPASTVWRDKPREDIPGSIWLPDTGYGALAPVMQQYFEQSLTQISGSDRDRMLVFYCLASCWMSWNAAKRALSIGYRNVAWYPDGTDGWAAGHLPLELRTPVPRPSVSE